MKEGKEKRGRDRAHHQRIMPPGLEEGMRGTCEKRTTRGSHLKSSVDVTSPYASHLTAATLLDGEGARGEVSRTDSISKSPTLEVRGGGKEEKDRGRGKRSPEERSRH